MSSILQKTLRWLPWLFPLLLFWIPLPIPATVGEGKSRILLLLLGYLLLVVFALPKSFFERFVGKCPTFEMERANGRRFFYAALCSLILSILTCHFHAVLPRRWEAVALLLAVALLWRGFSFFERASGVAGPASLVFFVSFLASLEAVLDRIPDDRLIPEARATPSLVTYVDRGLAVYRKNGFRGRRPSPDTDATRIVMLGGSSTYGIPMYHASSAYPAVLQRILDERRPTEHFEVLNGGVPGFGMVQMNDALEKVVLPLKPAIVSVCEYYNDTAPIPGWYGVEGKSDREGRDYLDLLERIDRSPLYKFWASTRIFSVARFYLLNARHYAATRLTPREQAPRVNRPRLSPEEYERELLRFVATAHRNDFLPVFIYEPLNRPERLNVSLERNGYYAAMQRVAGREDVPLVDSLTAMSAKRTGWYFYDIVHTNEAGHRLMAETIYDTLFTSTPVSSWARSVFATHHIAEGAPKVQREPRFQLTYDAKITKSLSFDIRAPFAGERRVMLTVVVNGHPYSSGSLIDAHSTHLEVPLSPDPAFGLRSLLDVSMHATYPTAGDPAFQIGTTGVFAPGRVEVASGGGAARASQSEIRFAGQRVDIGSRGYNVVVIGPKSASVLAVDGFDTYADADADNRLAEFLAGLGRYREGDAPPIVAVTVNTDGARNVDPALLRKSFGAIGVALAAPLEMSSWAAIGVFGAAEGTALTSTNPEFTSLSVGDKNSVAATLLEVRGLEE